MEVEQKFPSVLLVVTGPSLDGTPTPVKSVRGDSVTGHLGIPTKMGVLESDHLVGLKIRSCLLETTPGVGRFGSSLRTSGPRVNGSFRLFYLGDGVTQVFLWRRGHPEFPSVDSVSSKKVL